jgi:hypothetical protein
VDNEIWKTFIEENKLKYLLEVPNYLERIDIFRMLRCKINNYRNMEVLISAKDRLFLFIEISKIEINIYELSMPKNIFQFPVKEKLVEDDYTFVCDFLLEFFPELQGEDDELNGLINLFYDFVAYLKGKQSEVAV